MIQLGVKDGSGWIGTVPHENKKIRLGFGKKHRECNRRGGNGTWSFT